MGASTSTGPPNPQGFQLTYFQVNDIRVKNVFDELERNTSESVRGDREMSTCEMLAVIREADREEHEAVRDRRDLLRRRPARPAGLPAAAPSADTPARPDATARPTVAGWSRCRTLVLPKTAEAQSPDTGAGHRRRAGRPRQASSPARQLLPQGKPTPRAARPPASVPAPAAHPAQRRAGRAAPPPHSAPGRRCPTGR